MTFSHSCQTVHSVQRARQVARLVMMFQIRWTNNTGWVGRGTALCQWLAVIGETILKSFWERPFQISIPRQETRLWSFETHKLNLWFLGLEEGRNSQKCTDRAGYSSLSLEGSVEFSFVLKVVAKIWWERVPLWVTNPKQWGLTILFFLLDRRIQGTNQERGELHKLHMRKW